MLPLPSISSAIADWIQLSLSSPGTIQRIL